MYSVLSVYCLLLESSLTVTSDKCQRVAPESCIFIILPVSEKGNNKGALQVLLRKCSLPLQIYLLLSSKFSESLLLGK